MPPSARHAPPPTPKPLGWASRLTVAAAIVVGATLLRLTADPLLHDQVPYFIYVGSVVLATWFGGVGGGVLATFVAAFAGHYFFVPPRRTMVFRSEDVAAMAMFALLSFGLVWTVGRWKTAREALRQRAEEMQTILDTVPAAIFTTRTSDASAMEGNRFAAEFLRLPEGSNVSKTAPAHERPDALRICHDGEEIPGKELPVQLAIARGTEVRDYEFDVVYPDGTSRTLFGNATPLKGADGRTRGAIGAFVDITERKRAEDARRESERRFRAVLDGSRDVIYRQNVATRRYEYISPSAKTVLGFSAEELLELDAAQTAAIVHPDDLPHLRAATERVLVTGSEEATYRQRTRSGGFRWLSNHMSLARDASGLPVYREGNIRDVTDQKALEDVLRATLKELEDANRVKDEFLATLSHELRTPLNAVLGWSEMLLRPGLSAAAERKALESINRNARAQTALIGDILDVSRIISGKLRLDLGPVELREVLKAACESVQPAADARGVRLRATVEGRPILTGDPDRLQQVLWNLLSNGVKFCRAGGQVDVDIRRVDEQIRIDVCDDGEGIAPSVLPHVFERFRQGDSSTTRAQGGLGLGLAIVRHLVELHGGTVRAESDGEGRGARFTITLPIRQMPATGHLDPPVPSHQPKGPMVEPGCLEGLRILAVDDQEEARSLVQAVLERYGARVTLCRSAHEALAALSFERPDVLLADIGMPAMDGYELIRLVRALPDIRARAVPAIAVTAYGGERDRARAIGAGYSEHLAKPIIPDALVNVVALAAGRADCD